MQNKVIVKEKDKYDKKTKVRKDKNAISSNRSLKRVYLLK